MSDLQTVVEDWVANFDSTNDVDSYFEGLTISIEEFGNYFTDDWMAAEVDAALQLIHENVEELRTEERRREYDEDDYRWRAPSAAAETESSRSVFDDVDE
jgi:hypothetical protein